MNFASGKLQASSGKKNVPLLQLVACSLKLEAATE
jgi:hypothetical protein